jgi:hypothetical protein
MTTIQVEIPEISSGHGLSFKSGVADGLLDCTAHEQMPHKTHFASYQRGLAVGNQLKEKIAPLVKKSKK